MYKKSFVSISVSATKLKLVKLTNEGKKVSLAVMYDVPAGLIENGKVQKPAEFAALMKAVWKKQHIHDKTVGVVVPEFSTFMKALTLPKVALHELDEAVRWQAREFLPREGAEMILDWKIIDETKDSYEILLVAIEVEVLSGFVGAIDAAGLLPVFVETTSLCMERLGGEVKDTGKIVLYRSHGATIITVVYGKKILATSVITSKEDSSIVASVLQILSRFGKNIVGSISICGNGISPEFSNELHVKSGLSVDPIRLTIEGLTEPQVQDYIIALSQQYVNPEEPANAYSINLLPPSWVTHYKNQVRDLRLWTLTLVCSVVLWSCLLTSLAMYVILSGRATQSPSEKQGGADLQSVISQITKINALTNKIATVDKSIDYPQSVVNLIIEKKKEGISLTSFDVNMETGKVSFGGVASSRDVLLSFKNDLETVKQFSKVTLPITSLLTEQNVPFSITLLYKRI